MTKPCASCTKQIPEVALDCVFCGTRQPDAGAQVLAQGANNPLLGAGTAEIRAAVADVQPTQTKPTQAMAAVTMEESAPETMEPGPGDEVQTLEIVAPPMPRDWALLARVVLGMCGVVFVMLFMMPWRGVSSWTMLQNAVGADYVRQFYLLSGGVVLLVLAASPAPPGFRVQLGTLVALCPTIITAASLAGWRGAVASVAALGLAAAHLGAVRANQSRSARALVAVAVLAVLLLYVLPVEGATAVGAIVAMFKSGSLGLIVLALFFLLPLVFAALSLLGLIGRDLSDVDVLLGLLMALWGPIAVALRGLLMEDRAQLLVAMALLVSSLAATICAAELIGRAERRRIIVE